MLQICPLKCNTDYKKHLPQPPAGRYSSGTAKCEKDTVSFSGKEKDFLELSKKEIFEKINQSKNREHFIGSGGEANVYRIADTPYVVRIAKSRKQDFTERLSYDLSEQDKINHTVAKLGGDSRIMKYLPGENCFKYKNQNELFKLPVESYYNLYKQICHAKDNGMVFDCNSTNIIFNPKNKTLTAIDFYKVDTDFPENTKPLSAIFSALTTTTLAFHPENFKNLLSGLLNVVLKDFEPGVKPVQNLTELSLGSLFRNFESCYEDSLPPQYDVLKKTFYEALQLKYAESLGQDVKQELNGRIKICRALIKQVLQKEESLLHRLKLWEYEF